MGNYVGDEVECFECTCGKEVKFVVKDLDLEYYPPSILFRIKHQGVTASNTYSPGQLRGLSLFTIARRMTSKMRDKLWEAGNVDCASAWASAWSELAKADPNAG